MLQTCGMPKGKFELLGPALAPIDRASSGASKETQVHFHLLLALLYIQGPCKVHSCERKGVYILCSQSR